MSKNPTKSLVNMKYLEGVDEFLLLKVEQYSLESGVPLLDCFNEALTEWLECLAEPRLSTLRAFPQKKLKIEPKPALLIRTA